MKNVDVKTELQTVGRTEVIPLDAKIFGKDNLEKFVIKHFNTTYPSGNWVLKDTGVEKEQPSEKHHEYTIILKK